MPMEVCPACGCRFAVGLFRCPRCRATAPLFAARVEKETTMPRITAAGGPSNAGAVPGEPGYVEPAAEVSLVAEDALVPAEFAAEQLPPFEGLIEDGEAESAPASEQPTPASRKTGSRKATGGGAQ
jgi:hypothetical protein